MRLVEPKVFLVGETRIVPEGMYAFLSEIGVPEWESTSACDSEVIVEAAGKLCYMSFSTDLNKNLTKVGTRSNFDYIQDGIIGQNHGSVLEHVAVNLIFSNVSRVLCYHPDTELLTYQGWKKVTDIADDEILLTKDPITGKDHWSQNKKLHSFDFDGWLLGAKSSQWEAPLVTPDHLLWVKKHDVRTTPKYEKVPASWVQGLRYYQDHAINKDSVSVGETITIGEFCYPLVPLYRWLGWLASDGSVNKDRDYCSVVQTKKLESNELDKLFSLLFGDRFKKYGEDHCEWRITDSALQSWVLEKFGERTKAGRAFLGMFEDAPLLLEAFLGGMLSGDGSMAGGTVPVIYCRDEETAKHLQVLVALTGRSSNVRVDLSRIGQSRMVGEKVLINNLPAVCLHIHQSGESLCKKSHQIGVKYTGKVYCPQTEDGLVYARNKGRPVWSGNTHELVRHRAGAAYCLSGDAEVWSGSQQKGRFDGVKRKWTMKELYEKSLTPHGRSRLKLLKIRCFDGKEIVPAKIKGVTYSGKKNIFKVLLANGRSIRSSIDHRFMSSDGWLSVGDLSVGGSLACNGTNWAHTPEAVEKIRQGKLGSNNPMWRGDEVGAGGGRIRAQKMFEATECVRCGSTERLERHHVDRDPTNNEPTNVEVLCMPCHKVEHKQPIGLYPCWSEIVSITADGCEDTYDLEVDHPAHNFVANGVITHNSQTSGRYVRTDELAFWIPTIIKKDVELAGLFEEAVIHQEKLLAKMAEVAGINRMSSPGDFDTKKKLTSAFRRIVGNGVANNIECTFNHRALRHLIELRTSKHAEEEIRLVFNSVFNQVADRYPAIYADAHRTMVDGHFEITFKNSKV